MLFRNDLEKSCDYCAHGAKLGEEQILCTKRGVVSVDDPCGKFRYDPLKRTPPRPKAPDFSVYDEEDFSL